MEQKNMITYYVIQDLATWTMPGSVQSECERYEHVEEAMQKFRDYAQWQIVIGDDRIRATMGIRLDGLDFDVVYRISGKNILSEEFALVPFGTKGKFFVEALQKICWQLPVSHVRLHRQMTEEEKKEWTRQRFKRWVLLHNKLEIVPELEKQFDTLYEQEKLGRFLPSRLEQDVVDHVPLGIWDNPHFETLPPEHFALFVPSQSLYVCMQTSEMEFDYTLYDSQEHILDGGRLTGNGEWTIWDAMNDLFEELEVDWKDIIVLDHDRVKDWIESGGEK